MKSSSSQQTSGEKKSPVKPHVESETRSTEMEPCISQATPEKESPAKSHVTPDKDSTETEPSTLQQTSEEKESRVESHVTSKGHSTEMEPSASQETPEVEEEPVTPTIIPRKYFRMETGTSYETPEEEEGPVKKKLIRNYSSDVESNTSYERLDEGEGPVKHKLTSNYSSEMEPSTSHETPEEEEGPVKPKTPKKKTPRKRGARQTPPKKPPKRKLYIVPSKTPKVLRQMVHRREVLIGYLHEYRKYVDNWIDDRNLVELQVRTAKMRELWNRFEPISRALERKGTYLNKERHTCMAVFEEVVEKADAILSRQNCSIFAAVPVFAGDYDEWLDYYESFMEIVDASNYLRPCEKLFYLKNSLRDEPARALKKFSYANENYAPALDFLKKRYDDRHILVQTHINRLHELPSIDARSVLDLRYFMDELFKHTEALKKLKVPVDSGSANILLQCLITRKLDRRTRLRWQEFSGDKFPKFQDLWNFLTNYLHKGDSEELQCINCDEIHDIAHCRTFKNMKHSQKMSFLQENNLCYNCLRYNHELTECKWNPCRKCGLLHHTLLHPGNIIQLAERNEQQENEEEDEDKSESEQEIEEDEGKPEQKIEEDEVRPQQEIKEDEVKPEQEVEEKVEVKAEGKTEENSKEAEREVKEKRSEEETSREIVEKISGETVEKISGETIEDIVPETVKESIGETSRETVGETSKETVEDTSTDTAEETSGETDEEESEERNASGTSIEAKGNVCKKAKAKKKNKKAQGKSKKGRGKNRKKN